MRWKTKVKIKNQKLKIKIDKIVDILLENRGIKTKKQIADFFNPVHPLKISAKDVGIDAAQLKKAVTRIKKARKNKEDVIVYGDYDADGICATAIVWECLNKVGVKVMPHIPNRFSEGYGINSDSIKNLKLKIKNLKLIITVDNGIVANKAVDTANKLGIDVIISDHHLPGKILPKAQSIIHTTKIAGAGVAWFLAKELGYKSGLELAAIGTISDQLPVIGVNRSIIKHGLIALSKTNRVGIIEMFKEARIDPKTVGTYEVGFMIAPRINAMGRMKNGLDSLRLLCTKNASRAKDLSSLLGNTNRERQDVVESVVFHSQKKAGKSSWEGAIVLADESYHEGVIGLAAGKLVDIHWRPAIVISKQEGVSKGSARSIPGFNIIGVLRELEDLFEDIGGHEMAAGFSIKTKNIEKFVGEFEKIAKKLLTKKLLEKKLTIDMELPFNLLTNELAKKLKDFEPTGVGNPAPLFVSNKVEILELRTVGRDASHLKLVLTDNYNTFDAIAFKYGWMLGKVSSGDKIDIAYFLEENTWNGQTTLQLRVRDIKKGKNE